MLNFGGKVCLHTRKTKFWNCASLKRIFGEFTAWQFARKCPAVKFSKLCMSRQFFVYWELPATMCRTCDQNPQERLAKRVLSGYTHGKAAQRSTKDQWRDYISDLAWSCLSLETAELSIISRPPWDTSIQRPYQEEKWVSKVSNDFRRRRSVFCLLAHCNVKTNKWCCVQWRSWRGGKRAISPPWQAKCKNWPLL